jgi:hypothetical protein
MRPIRVEKGIAVEEACAQTKRLRMKIVVKRRPGKRSAVLKLLVGERRSCVRGSYDVSVLAPVHAAKGFVDPAREVPR